MTKKHFKVLAAILKDHRERLLRTGDESVSVQVIGRAVDRLCDEVMAMCRNVNENFKTEKFKEACHYGNREDE